MSKIDTLLKKAVAFEKLAIYSDRKSFLQALSQSASQEKSVKPLVELDEFGNPVPKGIPAPPAASSSSKDTQKADGGFDAETVKQFENLDEFGNPKQTGIPAPPGREPTSFQTTTPKVTEIPTVKITGMPPIRRSQQEALSRVVSIEGIGVPLKTDGVLGPETQKAIDAFKKKFDPTGKFKLTNQKVLDWAEVMADDPKYKS